MSRKFPISLTVLFLALGVSYNANAQSPPATPTHEVRALTTGKVMSCICSVVDGELRCPAAACTEKTAPKVDIRSLALFGATGDRRAKLRLSPGDGGQIWQEMMRQLYRDETIADSVAELVLEPYPMVANTRGESYWPLYRADIRSLRCTGKSDVRHTVNAPAQAFELDAFRRWVRGEVEKACGSPSTRAACDETSCPRPM